MTYLTAEQVNSLLQPINEHRVSHKQGQSHLEAYDVRRRLISDFGFARWSGDVTDVARLYEDITGEGGQRRVSVGYRATYRLTVCAPDGTQLATYTEAATGDATNFPISKWADAHDFAIKTAESQALKRCAINLGDAYGLGLYNGGKTDPLVRYVLGPDPARLNPDLTVSRPKGEASQETEKDDHITAPLAPEDTAPEDTPAGPADTGVVTSSPPPPAETPARQASDQPDTVDDIRARALAATKKVDLARLLSEAGQKKVAGAMTADADGTGMTLETLINQRIKALGRAA